VIGSEAEGIRRMVRKACDAVVRIPQAGRIGSLNASVAAGILLYEVVRGASPATVRGAGGSRPD